MENPRGLFGGLDEDLLVMTPEPGHDRFPGQTDIDIAARATDRQREIRRIDLAFAQWLTQRQADAQIFSSQRISRTGGGLSGRTVNSRRTSR